MRRCSSRNSRDIFSSSSSDSDDYSFGSSSTWKNHRRMLVTSAKSSSSPMSHNDWNIANRAASNSRPSSVNHHQSSTGRFATRQNGRVLPHLPSSGQAAFILPPPPPTAVQSHRDCWILSSQLTSCSPDDWTTEHDRPPSPAPMDPHCHWPSSVQLRLDSRARSPSLSGSTTSGSRRRHSRSNYQYRHSAAALTGATAGNSCPTSPAIRSNATDCWELREGSNRGPAGSSRRWRQSMSREQQRLESQIAFLRRQLKDVTDDYYYDDVDDDDVDDDDDDLGHGTPSSSSDSDSPRLLK